MRKAFIDTMLQLADKNDRIWLLCGDLGYSVLEPFFEKFPTRSINVGVAEQNMIGVAAGLARSGHVAFCYSIANFATLRCLEQIRNDVCYHDCNVNIVCTGGGVTYGAQGYTHHALEDLAVMRALPHMVVAAPGDPLEVRALTCALVEDPHPSFLRLGRAGEPNLHDEAPSLEIGQMLTLREGDEVNLLSTGGMLETALDVAELLQRRGISTGVTSVPFLKPLDIAHVYGIAQRTVLLCMIEEHGPIGGLGEAVTSCLAQLSGFHAKLLPFSLPEGSTKGVCGDQHHFRARGGLDPGSIVEVVDGALQQVSATGSTEPEGQ